MRAVSASLALAALLCITCSGCGSGSTAPYTGQTVPVKGKVTFKGKPVTQGRIRFEPKDSGREANGTIQSDGSFVMTTFKEGDGAVPGVHRVILEGAARQVRTSRPVEVEVNESKSDYAIDLQ